VFRERHVIRHVPFSLPLFPALMWFEGVLVCPKPRDLAIPKSQENGSDRTKTDTLPRFTSTLIIVRSFRRRSAGDLHRDGAPQTPHAVGVPHKG